ncbi:MAG TPA: deoxyribodipyrimidine photo-lyase [Gemmatales bacterium]|nr:deoxyribodipyrimidine photo-lyase [Gemmatales bacterium]
MNTLVWFRQDLRLSDHPALHGAVHSGAAILPVYIWEPDQEKSWQPGGASRWWLHHALIDLDQQLKQAGSHLIIRSGPALQTIQQLIQKAHVSRVVWTRRYEPHIIKRDEIIKRTLKEQGIDVESYNGSLLHEPMSINNKEGKPYQVYTPFWKCYQLLNPPRIALPAPKKITAPDNWPASLEIESLKLLPNIKWDAGLYETWAPSEEGARQSLKSFCQLTIGRYSDQRDLPGTTGTSQLSPYLHFGQISPNQVWHAVQSLRSGTGKPDKEFQRQSEVYLKELVWREFAYYLLYHFPQTPTQPLRSEFARFPWKDNAKLLRSWQKGQTGYPIVDAGMRQLWTTGWMHNRIRMVVASFLVKHLLIPWQRGAEWFWDTLVDADLASNTLGWQWTAGCGADAAPYFRIFNPMQQGERFDADGTYVRRWVPELAKMPARYIHAPWTSPAGILYDAGLTLGKTYPRPIVLHAESRTKALAAYDMMRGRGKD